MPGIEPMSIRITKDTKDRINALDGPNKINEFIREAIERELRRRSAIEPIIGHMKSDGHLGRCHLKGREGDAINVILTAVGHNLGRVLAWLRALLTSILIALWRQAVLYPAVKPAS